MKKNKYLIILGAGPQQIRAYQIARKLGLKTLALDDNPGALAKKFTDKFLKADIKNINECIVKLKKLKLNYRGVVVPGVEVMLTASSIAKEFNLRCVDEEVAYRTTNKCARLKVLKKAYIPIPKFEILKRFSLPKIPFPLVVKPADNSGSRGVRIVTSKKEWKVAYKEAKANSSDSQIVVEEFLRGKEVSIEGLILDGKMHVTGFVDRNYLKNTYPYFIEDGSWAPTLLSKAQVEKVKKVFARAAKALGIKAGPCKGDLIVTNKGIKVFEITSRLCPGFSLILPHATGVDILEAVIRWAAGMKIPIALLKQKYNRGMVHRYFCHQPGRITKIRGLKKLKDQPGVKILMFLKDFKLGDILKPMTYVNRLFYIFVVGKDRKAAINLAEKALKTVKIETYD